MKMKKYALFLVACIIANAMSFSGVYAVETESVADSSYMNAVCLLEALEVRTFSNPDKQINYNDFYDALVAILSNDFSYDISQLTGIDFSGETGSNILSGGDLCRSLVNLLGYKVLADAKGGTQDAYLYAAKRLEIINGLELATDTTVTARIVAIVLANALNTEMYQLSGIDVGANDNAVNYQVIEGETLLYVYRRIRRAEGVVEANGYTSLNAKAEPGQGVVRIGGKLYRDEKEQLADYLGYNMIFYYHDDGQTNSVLVAHENTLKNTVILVKKGNFSTTRGRKVSYYDTNDTEKTLVIPGAAAIIYNGKAVTEYQESIFSFKNETVAFIDNNNDKKIDVVSIKEAEDWFVADINAEFSIIHDKITGDEMYVNDADYERVRIFDENNTKVNVFYIAADDVLSVYASHDGRLIDIYVSRTRIKGKLESRISKNGYEMAKINGEEYLLTAAFYAREKGNLQLGQTAVFYLNKEGEVAYFDEEGVLMQYGYVMGTATVGTFASDAAVRMLVADGEIFSFGVSKIAYIDGYAFKKGNEFISFLNQCMTSGGSMLVRYDVDSDGKIYMIDTAYRSNKESENTLYTFGNMASDRYINSARLFQASFMMDDATLIFCCPSAQDKQSDEYYGVLTPALLKNATTFSVQGFGSDYSSFVPEAVVVDMPMTENLTVDRYSKSYAVKSVETVLDEEQEEVHHLVVFDASEEKEFYTTDIDVLAGIALNPGDIISACLTHNNKMSHIVKIYDGKTHTLMTDYYTNLGITTNSFATYCFMDTGYVYYSDGVVMALCDDEPSTLANRGAGKLSYYKLTNYVGCIVDSNYSDNDPRHIRRLTPIEIKDYFSHSDCARAFIRANNSSMAIVVIYQ